MIKRIIIVTLSIFLAFLILAVSVWKASAQTNELREATVSGQAVSQTEEATAEADFEEATLSAQSEDEKRVNYDLPYPGILPDHPLYWLKMIRDRIWLSLTTDPLRKAEVMILFADKRMGAAEALIKGNQAELGIKTASKASLYLQGALEQEERASQKGKETRKLLETLEKSTLKHQEILTQTEQKTQEYAGQKENIREQLQLICQQTQEKLRN